MNSIYSFVSHFRERDINCDVFTYYYLYLVKTNNTDDSLSLDKIVLMMSDLTHIFKPP